MSSTDYESIAESLNEDINAVQRHIERLRTNRGAIEAAFVSGDGYELRHLAVRCQQVRDTVEETRATYVYLGDDAEELYEAARALRDIVEQHRERADERRREYEQQADELEDLCDVALLDDDTETALRALQRAVDLDKNAEKEIEMYVRNKGVESVYTVLDGIERRVDEFQEALDSFEERARRTDEVRYDNQ